MSVNLQAYQQILSEVKQYRAKLIAVSKTKPVEDILSLYDMGHRDFGENYVQELVEKQPQLPQDIHWHFIGHLQSNKVKYIAPFVHMIHGVDSLKLLMEINKQAAKHDRIIHCLLQIHVASEETKFGLDEHEFLQLLEYYQQHREQLAHVRICGVMAMASFTDDQEKIRAEFRVVRHLFTSARAQYCSLDPAFREISIGMSADYSIALTEGSTMIRVGSLIFGERK